MHWAPQYRRANISHLLLQHKADCNAQDQDGQTPLHVAVWKQHENVCLLLLQHGADTKINDCNSQSEYSCIYCV